MRENLGSKMTTDVSKLSYAELLALKSQLEEQIDAKRSEEIKVLADGYVRKAIAAGFTPREALEAVQPYVPAASPKVRQAGVPVAIQFRDPANPGNAWSGRGRAPRWLVAYEQQGRSREDFRVATS